MDPAAAPAVPLSQQIVSWALAAVTGAGTITLACVGIAQNRREKERQEREDTPSLLLTGARDGETTNYNIEIANLSSGYVWLAGVYTDWWSQGDARVRILNSDYTNHRTPVPPGGWVKLWDAFGPQRPEERVAEVVAVFHYAPTGVTIHRRAWRIRAQGYSVESEDIDIPAWFNEQRQGA